MKGQSYIGVDPSVDDVVTQTSPSGAASLPYGTNAERPALPDEFAFRGSEETNDLEVFRNGFWRPVGAPKGGGSDTVFLETSYTVTTDYTITAGKSAITIPDANGNVTVSAGVTITIPTGSVWVIPAVN